MTFLDFLSAAAFDSGPIFQQFLCLPDLLAQHSSALKFLGEAAMFHRVAVYPEEQRTARSVVEEDLLPNDEASGSIHLLRLDVAFDL